MGFYGVISFSFIYQTTNIRVIKIIKKAIKKRYNRMKSEDAKHNQTYWLSIYGTLDFFIKLATLKF